MTRSVYVLSPEGLTGKSVVALGLLDALARTAGRVGVFRPLFDSRAEVDLNVVMQESGDFVEIQGTGEHGLFGREELNEMLDVAQKGCRELIDAQKAALGW